jgi:hypothetical protein
LGEVNKALVKNHHHHLLLPSPDKQNPPFYLSKGLHIYFHPALDLPTTGAKVTHAFADIFFFLPFARVHTGAETETRALVVHGDGMVCSSFFLFRCCDVNNEIKKLNRAVRSGL